MLWQTFLFVGPSQTTPLADSVGQRLKENGYKAYDPFPGGLGSPIGKVSRLRMFLAPTLGNWTRLLIGPNDDMPLEQVKAIAQAVGMDVVWPQLLDEQHFSIGYIGQDGTIDTTWEPLRPWLNSGLVLKDLHAVANRPFVSKTTSSTLPPDVQALASAKGVEMRHVDKMMGKMTRRLFGKDQEADALQQAQAGLASQVAVDWNIPSGQQLVAVMGCLDMAEDYWRLPTWDTLTAAYQVARQRQRGQGDLLPTDAAALAAVPNALDYTLLYFSTKL